MRTGSLIISLQGLQLTAEETEILNHPLIGGVIFFTRNYHSKQQLKQLCTAIRQDRPHYLLLVDQEGGRVQRFKDEFTQLPSMAYFGQLYDEQAELALTAAKNCGWLMASEILSASVDLSLAPVLDLNKGANSMIGDRAFHADTQAVSLLAQAFIQGMQEAGMQAVGKHFPGHGSVVADTHLGAAIDARTLDEITQTDLLPFASLIQKGIPAIMTSHLIIPQGDSLPVSFSPFWLKIQLRSRLGFKGTIFSDDLNMEGANISQSYTDRVRQAHEAGCDFMLLCNNHAAVVEVLDACSQVSGNHDQNYALQGCFSTLPSSLQQTSRWQAAHSMCQSILSVERISYATST